MINIILKFHSDFKKFGQHLESNKNSLLDVQLKKLTKTKNNDNI